MVSGKGVLTYEAASAAKVAVAKIRSCFLCRREADRCVCVSVLCVQTSTCEMGKALPDFFLAKVGWCCERHSISHRSVLHAELIPQIVLQSSILGLSFLKMPKYSPWRESSHQIALVA